MPVSGRAPLQFNCGATIIGIMAALSVPADRFAYPSQAFMFLMRRRASANFLPDIRPALLSPTCIVGIDEQILPRQPAGDSLRTGVFWLLHRLVRLLCGTISLPQPCPGKLLCHKYTYAPNRIALVHNLAPQRDTCKLPWHNVT